ncbi:MAG: hypothetical protein JNM88_00510 [Chitinophagaceae bacterium]|nr:hypothetical protein [Chitinophagaceae bacterium]
MIRTTFTAVIILLLQQVQAQTGAADIIKAEKDFAAYASAFSTKEAFLQVIDSNSIMFDNGKPVKALEYWAKREKNSGVLKWQPQYIEISLSRTFGYTTGPWTFQPSRNDTVVATGQYTTIWYKNKNGQWKFLVDYGTDNNLPGGTNETIIETEKIPDSSKVIPHIAFLVNADRNLNNLLHKSKGKAYSAFLSAHSILSRNGSLPAVTPEEREALIDSTPAAIRYSFAGWGESPAKDMGYTYGMAELNGKRENYFRIWRREKKGWKIAVEVVRY